MCFWTKSKNTTNNITKNQTQKPLPEPRIEPGTTRTQRRCFTSALPSQLSGAIVVKLLTVGTQWVKT